MRCSPLTLAAICVLVAVPATAATIRVPEHAATIQDAFGLAAPGDVISVAPGHYQGNVAFTQEHVTLRSRVRHAATLDAGGQGHVVSLNNVHGTIEGFVITGSEDRFYGGVFTSQKSQAIRDNIIEGNAGHGVRVSSGSAATIEGNVIRSNGSSGQHSAISVLTGGSITAVNNLIVDHLEGIAIWSPGPRSRLVNNTVSDCGDFAIRVASAEVDIHNNILVGSQYGIVFLESYSPDRDAYVASFLDVRFNDVWDHSQAGYWAELINADLNGITDANVGAFQPLPGYGTLSVDPGFVGAPDYSLASGSACIDAGDASLLPEGIELDVALGSRVVGLDVDLGAYERALPTATPEVPGTEALVAVRVHPNPFNPKTTIAVDVERTGFYRVEILALSGRRIARLHEGTWAKGQHQLTWHGRDSGDRRVASGVYRLVVQGGGTQVSGSLVLIE